MGLLKAPRVYAGRYPLDTLGETKQRAYTIIRTARGSAALSGGTEQPSLGQGADRKRWRWYTEIRITRSRPLGLTGVQQHAWPLIRILAKAKFEQVSGGLGMRQSEPSWGPGA